VTYAQESGTKNSQKFLEQVSCTIFCTEQNAALFGAN